MLEQATIHNKPSLYHILQHLKCRIGAIHFPGNTTSSNFDSIQLERRGKKTHSRQRKPYNIIHIIGNRDNEAPTNKGSRSLLR